MYYKIFIYDTIHNSFCIGNGKKKRLYRPFCLYSINGAGEGNRTLATSLEGWGSTIELHPQIKMVGAAGFEPATPWSQARCATKLRYAPISSTFAIIANTVVDVNHYSYKSC